MSATQTNGSTLCRLIVVGGHTRSIGKTQLVCDVIRAFPKTCWIAGKITQYGHGVCTRDGKRCDCAPKGNVCTLTWEAHPSARTDSGRFLAAGAARSFWLRARQGHLAEALPSLRRVLRDPTAAWDRADGCTSINRCTTTSPAELSSNTFKSEGVPAVAAAAVPQAFVVESNSLVQFVQPSLYLAVIDPTHDDFKNSAKMVLDRADVLVLRGELGEGPPSVLWLNVPPKVLQEKVSVLQREGESLPESIWGLVHRVLEAEPQVRV